jgi:hypothetical protein
MQPYNYALLGAHLRTADKDPDVLVTVGESKSRLSARTSDEPMYSDWSRSFLLCGSRCYCRFWPGCQRRVPQVCPGAVTSTAVERGWTRIAYIKTFAAGSMDSVQALYSHTKILVAALNGPAVGLSAGWSLKPFYITSKPQARSLGVVRFHLRGGRLLHFDTFHFVRLS